MITGTILKNAIISGAHNIANNRYAVDELNVFPVPDGDTGTNMSMTINNAVKELEKLPDNVTVEKAASTAASAMLRGARGNSGVILSLLFRGFSKALAGKKEMDAQDMRNALEQGVEGAYKAVMQPTEGTILTVARVASEQAAESILEDTLALWEVVLETSKVTLEATPDLLPILKKAGVVDAGGMGLVYIFEGMHEIFAGKPMVELQSKPEEKARPVTVNVGKGVFAAELNPDITNGYCTEFLINKEENANAEKLRAFLESNGDSVVVVDDDDIIKCHVHTKDPGKILTHAVTHGFLTKLKIENMHEQYEARQEEAKALEKQAEAEAAPKKEGFNYVAPDKDTPFGFVAVAAGKGLKAIFTDLGADAVVSGGQTNNPSTDDILSAVQSVAAKTVFVLPNNKNIIMAAEQAVGIADRKVIVLPTRTVPQGITAMLNFDASATEKENTVAMNLAAEKVSTGMVTYAARDSEFGGRKIKKGEILALENGRLAFTEKDVAKALAKLAKKMVNKDSSFVTFISGQDVKEKEAQVTIEEASKKLPKHVEVSHLDGGQPIYYYMISVE